MREHVTNQSVPAGGLPPFPTFRRFRSWPTCHYTVDAAGPSNRSKRGEERGGGCVLLLCSDREQTETLCAAGTSAALSHPPLLLPRCLFLSCSSTRSGYLLLLLLLLLWLILLLVLMLSWLCIRNWHTDLYICSVVVSLSWFNQKHAPEALRHKYNTSPRPLALCCVQVTSEINRRSKNSLTGWAKLLLVNYK